jgi:hypothetical protein
MQRRTTLTLLTGIVAGPAFAMYDPKPNSALALAPGHWTGTLTYRDWSNPDKMVTLPCKMAVALTRPDELALYFVFNDGPGKTVYSYDRMSFDFDAQGLVWSSGTAKPSSTSYKLTSVRSDADATRLDFERTVEGRVDRYALAITKRSWSLSKVEVAASGLETFRNRYDLVRGDA